MLIKQLLVKSPRRWLGHCTAQYWMIRSTRLVKRDVRGL
jgi:hypothetical protein